MPNRGEFTPAIKAKMDEFMSRETTRAEFRLLPYIQYTMVNNQKIDPNHVNGEDRTVLTLWREAGHIEGGASGLAITEQFWEFLNSILWLGYVAYREQADDLEPA